MLVVADKLNRTEYFPYFTQYLEVPMKGERENKEPDPLAVYLKPESLCHLFFIKYTTEMVAQNKSILLMATPLPNKIQNISAYANC